MDTVKRNGRGTPAGSIDEARRRTARLDAVARNAVVARIGAGHALTVTTGLAPVAERAVVAVGVGAATGHGGTDLGRFAPIVGLVAGLVGITGRAA